VSSGRQPLKEKAEQSC